MTLALVAVGVPAGCDADVESEMAATTVVGSRDAAVGSAVPPSPSTVDCGLVRSVRAVVEEVATIGESSSVASAEETRDALLRSVQELKVGSPALRTTDVKALNEGLAEVASAVTSASQAQTVESAISSLQGSARDLEGAIQQLEHHLGCNPEAG